MRLRILIGIGLFFGVIFVAIYALYFRSATATAQASVSVSRFQTYIFTYPLGAQPIDGYQDAVSFTAPAGQNITFSPFFNPFDHSGAVTPVSYDPANPQHAFLPSDGAIFLFTPAALAFLFLCSALMYWLHCKPVLAKNRLILAGIGIPLSIAHLIALVFFLNIVFKLVH